MKKKMRTKRRYITLMEIMIVIVLIGLIGGVLAYNMRGSLDQGKMSATQTSADRLRSILQLETARGADPEELMRDLNEAVKKSGLANDPKKITKDGWGNDYTVEYSTDKGDFSISSPRYILKFDDDD